MMRTILAYAWAFPWSVVGASVGSLAVLYRGQVGFRDGVCYFFGGRLGRWLNRVPLAGGASAMTFGHVVLAADRRQLDRCWRHELVHVRQYERWGPLFVVAYLVCSLRLWFRGRDPYLDNPFEREAYGDTP